jgi:phytanoyl-CoA hydroxylase
MVSVCEFLDRPQARAQALEDYRRNGYLILTEVFTPAEVAQMHEAWTKIADERSAAGKKPYANLLMTHVSNPGVASVVRNPLLVKSVEAVLGGRIELIQSQLMHGRPGSKGFSPHQDNFFNRAEPKDDIIAAWIAVEPVDRENGSLAAYPRSHVDGLVKTRRDWFYLVTRSLDIAKSLLRIVMPKGRVGPDDSGVVERYAYASAPKGVQAIPVALAPGSVALMHGDLIHFSYPNQTESRFRRSLVANFIRVGTKFAAGPLTRRTPFDVYAS